MNTQTIIGLTGYARSGKDTVADMLLERLKPAKKIKFADALKNEVRQTAWEQFGIDSFTEDPVAKQVIRPLIVGWGTARRMQDPEYWTQQALATMCNAESEFRAFVFADVRYANEANIIHLMGGIVVQLHRAGVHPANEEERRSIAEINRDLFLCTETPWKPSHINAILNLCQSRKHAHA